MRHVTKVCCCLLATLWEPGFAGTPDLQDDIEFQGDFRLRYESIDPEGGPGVDRSRYRVRFGAGLPLYDDLRVVLSLATAADNPISRNVTFGGNEVDDSFGVDLAYAEWQASDALEVLVGKMTNPMIHPGRAQLLYDNDLNPGGIASVFATGPWFVNGGAFQVESRASDNTYLYHVQAGAGLTLPQDASLTLGAGYLEYTNTVGVQPFVFGLPAGNTVDSAGNYVFDYANAEVFAELEARLAGWPIRVFAHYTENVDVSREESAYALGLQFGKASKQGTAQADWHYKDVEADAVLGSFTESDFGGGGTDVKGHVLRARYMLRERVSVSGTLFLNEIHELAGDEIDYRRLQLDLEFKFD